MKDVIRLTSIGFPLEDALSLCHTFKKEGDLEAFIKQAEDDYRKRCAEFVGEVVD